MLMYLYTVIVSLARQKRVTHNPAFLRFRRSCDKRIQKCQF